MYESKPYMGIVKGSPDDAIRACTERGFDSVAAEPHDKHWTHVYVDTTFEAMAAWFANAPKQCPFPVGTLLWYRED